MTGRDRNEPTSPGPTHDVPAAPKPCTRAERERRRAEQLEALDRLAGGIAHDFNNFLASMIGNLQLAQLDAKPGTAIANALTQADGACRRAQELARRLLTFTKGGAPVCHPTSLTAVLEQAARRGVPDTPTRVEVTCAEDLAPAQADEGQLGQVLGDLLQNAAEAMPAGGTVRITAENHEASPGNALALRPGRYVHVQVIDEGGGIPEDDLDRVFQPYFTTKKGGKGLGLATSYSILRRHEGTLTVDSKVGEGTTAHLYLPAAATGERMAMVRPDMRNPGGERILWLEDDRTIASVVERMLARYGYHADMCEDGSQVCTRYAQALERGEAFDLVVLDLGIPGGMGGKEALAELRRMNPNVRAVACSGRHDHEAFADPAALGFCAALPKPFTREALASVLIDALAGARRRSEAA